MDSGVTPIAPPDPYGYWKARLSEAPNPDQFKIWTGDGIDDCPQPGLWCYRRAANAPLQPVHVWLDDGGAVRISIAGQEDPDLAQHSRWFRPVTKEAWTHYHDHGLWPGEIADGSAGVGHNSGEPLPLPQEAAEAARLAQEFLTDIKSTVTGKEQADRCANYEARLTELRNKAEAERKKEKQPHWDAGLAVDAKWNAIKAPLEDAVADLAAARKAWQIAEQKRIDAEVEAARQEALRVAREAQAKADAEAKRLREEAEARAAAEAKAKADVVVAGLEGTGVRVDPAKIAESLYQPPEPIVVPAAAPVVVTVPEDRRILTGGQRGKRKGLRKETIYTITDIDKVWPHVKGHPDVVAAIQAAVVKLGKAGMVLDGVSVSQDYV